MNSVRMTRTGDCITTGQVTIGEDGLPSLYIREEETRSVLFDWSEYYCKPNETVLVSTSLADSDLVLDKTDLANSARVSISGKYGDVALTVDIDGGETFVMRLKVNGECKKDGYAAQAWI